MFDSHGGIDNVGFMRKFVYHAFHPSYFWYVAVATIVGTFVAFLLVPMRSLGQDNWKIAAALMGSYIGGCKCQDKLKFVVSPEINYYFVLFSLVFML